MGQTTSKTCPKCGETKPLDQFGRDNGRPDGKNPYCLACVREITRMRLRSPADREPCLCGCGEYPGQGRSKYVRGHYTRGVAKREPKPCTCGCGGLLKECPRCLRLLHSSEFSPRKDAPDGLYHICKPCSSENTMRWRDDNPEKWLDYRLKREFGITLDDYNALLEKQNGLCAICRQPPGIALGRESKRPRRNGVMRVPRLVVDHDHATGEVRGLLCVHCNRGIGFLKDDPEIVRLALKYLKGGELSQSRRNRY